MNFCFFFEFFEKIRICWEIRPRYDRERSLETTLSKPTKMVAVVWNFPLKTLCERVIARICGLVRLRMWHFGTRGKMSQPYQPWKRSIFGTTRCYNRGTIGDDFVKMGQIPRRNGEGRLHPLDMSNGCNRPFPFPPWILRILVKSSPIVPRIKNGSLRFSHFLNFSIFFWK